MAWFPCNAVGGAEQPGKLLVGGGAETGNARCAGVDRQIFRRIDVNAGAAYARLDDRRRGQVRPDQRARMSGFSGFRDQVADDTLDFAGNRMGAVANQGQAGQGRAADSRSWCPGPVPESPWR